MYMYLCADMYQSNILSYVFVLKKDLVRRLLKLDPAERASIPEVLNHVWMRAAMTNQYLDISAGTLSASNLLSSTSALLPSSKSSSGAEKRTTVRVSSHSTDASYPMLQLAHISFFGVLKFRDAQMSVILQKTRAQLKMKIQMLLSSWPKTHCTVYILSTEGELK